MADQVFMCYARQDEGFVLELAGALKAQGVPVWIDQWALPVGADWDMEIEEALSKSSHLVLVISPASMRSHEVRDEWRAVIDEGVPIIPVLLEECRIHRRLRQREYVDFTSTSPNDAAAVGEIVSALGMGQPARETEERPPDLSAEPSAGPSSERLSHPDRGPVLEMTCPDCGARIVPGMIFCDNCGLDLRVAAPSGKACSACGAAYEAGMVFCENCGVLLPPPPQVREPSENVCPNCGAKNPPGAVFCDNCGASLPPPPVSETSGNLCPFCEAAYEPGMTFCEECGTLLPSAPSADLGDYTAARLSPEAKLQGRYVVRDEIAQGGGTGAFYRVSDLRLRGKEWALKEIDFSVFSIPGDRQKAVEESRREGKILARLDHPNVVKVVDLFEDKGNLYLVMEFFQGMTLDQILSRDGGPLAVDRVLRWAEQICDALSYLHAQNPPVIYRDLKPQTVLELASTHQIKLIDFGIARFYVPGLGRDESPVGTPGYAPPEQYGKGQTDARSDLYALGAMLHHLLTGRDPYGHPFSFPSVRSLNSAIPRDVEAAISRALKAEPEERFQMAEEMKRALLRGT